MEGFLVGWKNCVFHRDFNYGCMNFEMLWYCFDCRRKRGIEEDVVLFKVCVFRLLETGKNDEE